MSTCDGPPSKNTLIEQCERAKRMLEERRYRDNQLIKLLDEIHSGAGLSSAALQERPYDYWAALAHNTEPLSVTLRSYKAGDYPEEPTNKLREQIAAFIGAAEDAARAAQ
jgi:hypothetical protein